MKGVGELKLLIWVLSILCLIWVSTGFDPVDNYLIDCGSPTNTSVDNRVFMADNSASQTLSTSENILAKAEPNSISIESRLYQTARILNGISRYTFPIRNLGRHWIRLHFFPFVYQNYNLSTANFSVSTQDFVFFSNFRSEKDSGIKEYSLNITSDNLILTFTPKNGSFAFLNALEVVSIPDEIITDIAQTIKPFTDYHGLWKQALETVWRINMGGPRITPRNDTLSRTWIPDDNFLLNKNLANNVSNIGAVQYVDGGPSQDIAPVNVYGTAKVMNSRGDPNSIFNVTWVFHVDPGFKYLIRLHFCDIVSLSLNNLYFNVYINAEIVYQDLDLSSRTPSLGAPFYGDFVTGLIDGEKVSVSIGPATTDAFPNAILNGLELMKMNNSRSSLDGNGMASVTLPWKSGSGSRKKKVGLTVGLVIGAVFVVVVLLVGLFFMCRRRGSKLDSQSKIWTPLSTNGGATQSMGSKYSNGTTAIIASNVGYRFPFVAIQEATNSFDESWVIGVGGFGKVYKGELKDGTKVAVKRGNPQSHQGLAEFRTEIEMLSQLRHRHLVPLIGYCDERNEMILVYEYMENGTLKSHLYGSEFPSLSWKQRLEICIGSARGLHYLHTGPVKAIIHRDVKSANILLDEDFVAKVADFGLSKTGPEIDQTHVSTAVKGSFGYLDPEYFRRQQLTEKSDVYSFGVVMFEVLCGRPVINPSLPRDMVNLAEWAMKWQKRGELEQVMDTHLRGNVRPGSLRKFAETAEKCLADCGVDRPSMGDVLWNLEYALQLQDAVIRSDLEDDDSINQIGNLSSPPQVDDGVDHEEASFTGTRFGMSNVDDDDLSGVSMSKVFSQLVKAEGR